MTIIEKKYASFLYWLFLEAVTVIIWVCMIFGTAVGTASLFFFPHRNWVLASMVGGGSLIALCFACLLALPSLPHENVFVRIFGFPFWICIVWILCASVITISVYPAYYL
ncbi:MAG TPA: hypothetical protein VLG69_02725 [Candidatus Andersenbacteria bacterium]|nr:hypothetical protein [Candidatus Andersenbacteria bacterium]